MTVKSWVSPLHLYVYKAWAPKRKHWEKGTTLLDQLFDRKRRQVLPVHLLPCQGLWYSMLIYLQNSGSNLAVPKIIIKILNVITPLTMLPGMSKPVVEHINRHKHVHFIVQTILSWWLFKANLFQSIMVFALCIHFRFLKLGEVGCETHESGGQESGQSKQCGRPQSIMTISSLPRNKIVSGIAENPSFLGRRNPC